MFSLFRKEPRSSTQSVDVIEKIVYEYLKPLGFHKHGRTLHRFVDGDISQVVNFQNGSPQKGIFGILWVNLGIRIPECVERKFIIETPLKKYYHEYECNIRTRLGTLVDGEDTVYDLRKDPNRIGKDIVARLEKHVLPVFDVLDNRDGILAHRRECAAFEHMAHLILLDEAMIVGRRGDLAEAERLLNVYYQEQLAEYQRNITQGKQIYLKKGQRMIYRNPNTNETETIVAEKDGFVTTYNGNKAHITYLENLAKELGLQLHTP